jgi:hypothetical protein
MGADEIFFGKKQKFVTVVSNLGTVEPGWFGRDKEEGDAGRVLLDSAQRGAKDAGHGRLCRHVGTVPAEY